MRCLPGVIVLALFTLSGSALAERPRLVIDRTPIEGVELRGSPQAAKASREQEISEISRGLKSLAKELNCPVLALS